MARVPKGERLAVKETAGERGALGALGGEETFIQSRCTAAKTSDYPTGRRRTSLAETASTYSHGLLCEETLLSALPPRKAVHRRALRVRQPRMQLERRGAAEPHPAAECGE